MTRHGEFNWNELQTCDAEKARSFYAKSLGWQFRAETMPSGGTYWIGLVADLPVCGILTLPAGSGNHQADRWITYIHVDHLDDAVARVSEQGGQVLREPWQVPGVGRVAMIVDPGGAEIGWVTPV